MTKTTKKRIGRPTRPARPGARVSLGLRVTAEIKQRLDDAAERSGRSQSQEAEMRLERSFEGEDRLGGPELMQLVETIATVMKGTGEHAAFYATGKPANRGAWLGVPYAYDQALQGAQAILEARRPPGEIVEPPPRKLVEVIGIRGTKVDPKQSAAQVQKVFANLGRLMAAYALEKGDKGDD